MPQRNSSGNQYRYGYQGQELDPETGKPAFQLRLYDPRIMRWLTTDPAGQYHSPYMAMGNNWITRIDPDGGEDDTIYQLEGTDQTVNVQDGVNLTVEVDQEGFNRALEFRDMLGPWETVQTGFNRDEFYAYKDFFNKNVFSSLGSASNYLVGEFLGGGLENPWINALTVPPISTGGASAFQSAKHVTKGSRGWKSAVKTLKGGAKKANFIVDDIGDAKALLQESFGNLNRVKRYKNLSRNSPQRLKRYEVHKLDKINSAREIAVGNKLDHIKFNVGKQSGHIYFK